MFSGSKAVIGFKLLIAIALGGLSIYGSLMFFLNLFMNTTFSTLIICSFIMAAIALLFYGAYEKFKNKS